MLFLAVWPKNFKRLFLYLCCAVLTQDIFKPWINFFLIHRLLLWCVQFLRNARKVVPTKCLIWCREDDGEEGTQNRKGRLVSGEQGSDERLEKSKQPAFSICLPGILRNFWDYIGFLAYKWWEPRLCFGVSKKTSPGRWRDWELWVSHTASRHSVFS